MKVYLLATEEYYSGYIVYAASESPIHYVGSINIPYEDNYGRRGIRVLEVNDTDVLRRPIPPYARTIGGEGCGWEIVWPSFEKDETKYKYKAVREFLGRSE